MENFDIGDTVSIKQTRNHPNIGEIMYVTSIINKKVNAGGLIMSKQYDKYYRLASSEKIMRNGVGKTHADAYGVTNASFSHRELVQCKTHLIERIRE